MFHVVAALITAGLLALLVLVRAARSAPQGSSAAVRARAAAWVALVTAPALALTALSFTAASAYATAGHRAADWHAPALERLFALGRLFAPGPSWRGAVVLLAAVAAAVWALARGDAAKRTARDEALACGSLSLFVAAWLLPTHLPKWDFFSPGFPLGRAPGSPCCRSSGSPRAPAPPPAWPPRSRSPCAQPAQFHRALVGRVSDAWSGLARGAVVRGPRLEALIDPLDGFAPRPWDREVPELNPPAAPRRALRGGRGGHDQHAVPRAPERARADRRARRVVQPHQRDPNYYNSLLPAAGRPPAWRRAVLDVNALAGNGGYTDVLVLGRRDAHERFFCVDAPSFARGGS